MCTRVNWLHIKLIYNYGSLVNFVNIIIVNAVVDKRLVSWFPAVKPVVLLSPLSISLYI